MKTKLLKFIAIIIMSYSFALNSQTTSTFIPVKDNSIYSGNNNSNGQGSLYSGNTCNSAQRRALIKFDISSIPSQSTITSASLSIRVSKFPTSGSTTLFKLHKVTKDWGEGTSDAGGNGGAGVPAIAPDATWSYAKFNTSTWINTGGDFDPTVLASLNIPRTIAAFTFTSTSGLVDTVQNWLDAPSSNHGLIVIGDETTACSAREFDSKDAGISPPQLSVTYTNPLGMEDIAINNFTIFPNPSHSKIKLEIPNSLTNALVSVLNILGKEIYKLPLLSEEPIDVSGWSNGLYFIKISSEEQILTKRFIKY